VIHGKGLLSVIPLGRASNSSDQLSRCAGIFVLFKFLTQASLERDFHKTKIPQLELRELI
jgi:hypothetical protein